MRVRLGPVSRRRRTDLFVEKAMFRSSRSLATAQEIRFNTYGSESNTSWTIVSWGKVKHRCRAVREHSKSAILMDNNAGTRSSSAFGAEQHLCKRPSALAVLTGPDQAPYIVEKTPATLKTIIYNDRNQSGPKVNVTKLP